MRLLIRLTFYLLSLQNLTSISGKEWSVISNQRRRIRDLSRLKEIPDRFRKSVSQLFVIQERSNHWRGALCISWNSTDSPLNRDHPHELSSRSIYSFIYPTYPRSMSRISLHLDRRKKLFRLTGIRWKKNALRLWRGYFLMKLVWDTGRILDEERDYLFIIERSD